MGKEARVALMLAAAACLLAVMGDWVVEELHGHPARLGPSRPVARPRQRKGDRVFDIVVQLLRIRRLEAFS